MGNCRMYYLSENYLQYITPDHSLAYLAHSQGKFRFPGIAEEKARAQAKADGISGCGSHVRGGDDHSHSSAEGRRGSALHGRVLGGHYRTAGGENP